MFISHRTESVGVVLGGETYRAGDNSVGVVGDADDLADLAFGAGSALRHNVEHVIMDGTEMGLGSTEGTNLATRVDSHGLLTPGGIVEVETIEDNHLSVDSSEENLTSVGRR